MIRELSFNYTTEDGETVRALAVYEEPELAAGIWGGWQVEEVQLIDDETNAILGREQAEKRFGIQELDQMDVLAAELDRKNYEVERLDRYDTREG